MSSESESLSLPTSGSDTDDSVQIRLDYETPSELPIVSFPASTLDLQYDWREVSEQENDSAPNSRARPSPKRLAETPEAKQQQQAPGAPFKRRRFEYASSPGASDADETSDTDCAEIQPKKFVDGKGTAENPVEISDEEKKEPKPLAPVPKCWLIEFELYCSKKLAKLNPELFPGPDSDKFIEGKVAKEIYSKVLQEGYEHYVEKLDRLIAHLAAARDRDEAEIAAMRLAGNAELADKYEEDMANNWEFVTGLVARWQYFLKGATVDCQQCANELSILEIQGGCMICGTCTRGRLFRKCIICKDELAAIEVLYGLDACVECCMKAEACRKCGDTLMPPDKAFAATTCFNCFKLEPGLEPAGEPDEQV